MSLSSAGLTGAISVLGAIGAAVLYLATNAWFGAGDLQAMLIWSLPLGLVMTVASHRLSRRLSNAGTSLRYATLMLSGGLLGFLWTVVATLLLGAWIGAFSFPVLFCWITGGFMGGIAAAWWSKRRTWPGALALVGIVVLALRWGYGYIQAPEPRLRIIVKPGATPTEVGYVWTHVLGRPTGRPDEHALLPELSSVAASGYDGESAILTVSFWKSVRRRERDSLVELIRHSPLIVRVNEVSTTDTTGVRASASY